MSLMTPVHRALLCVVVSAAGLAACASDTATESATRPSGPPFAAVWQRHQTTINYFGLTALYSCDSLEDKVRTLLLYLGARPDLKVQQLGCDRAFDRPGHLASVQADFYTLAPASDTAAGTGGGTVTAQWATVSIKPMAPYWMGYGECELMQQIKPVIIKDYSARDLHYQTACVPRDATVSDYELNGEFPQATVSR